MSCRAILIGWALSLGAIFPAAAAEPTTWAERLGYPAGKKVLILHADDVGMCYEANQAAQQQLTKGEIQSAAMMMPCPWVNEMCEWYKAHPDYDIGLHLALTSEWKWYRWGPVAPREEVLGLLDNEGYMWRDVLPVTVKATPAMVEREIRAQIARAKERGVEPSHIDTHMGTLYARLEFTEAYLRVSRETNIPAMAIEPSPRVIEKFKAQGYPFNEKLVQMLREHPLPKLDDFHAAPEGKTYEEKKQKFMTLVQDMQPGINEVIFHPSVLTECLKKITGSWQQRAWEAEMFGDPELKQYFEREGVVFTNWKEMMKRHQERGGKSSAAGQ